MPRIRTIKPELWQDEKLAALPPMPRLVFLGLISMADDAGRLVDNVKSIDGFIFPETDDSAKESLGILARLSRIFRYVAPNGQKCIQIVHWARHQKVDHPNKYVLPAPDAEALAAATVAPVSVETREGVATPSRNPLATTSTPTPTSTPTNRSSYSDEFEEAWQDYPRRPGNSKKAAYRAWNARLKQGACATEMRAGVRAYAEHVKRMNLEPRFIKLASTFFGPGEHYAADYSAQHPATLELTDDFGRPRLHSQRDGWWGYTDERGEWVRTVEVGKVPA